MNNISIGLTEQGRTKIRTFIENLEIKRSELIHAGLADEDDETVIPDEEDIIADITEWFDNCAIDLSNVEHHYESDWKATENSKPETLELSSKEDFVLILGMKRGGKTFKYIKPTLIAPAESEAAFEALLDRTAMGEEIGGWKALIESNAHSMSRLERIRERLKNILAIDEAVFAHTQNQWAISITKAELKRCDDCIEQLRQGGRSER